jgi:hypothetical protein
MVRRCRVLISLLLLLQAGCSTLGLQRDIGSEVALQHAAVEIPEDHLLDVWIELFDAGTLPGDKDDASGLSMDIRQAESRYMPVVLRDAMEKTGYWGAVRVVPRDTEGGEVVVRGAILASDGERLELRITALDATGREWFSRIYESAKVAASAYQPGVQPPVEPFQSVYYTIANDLASFRDKLTVGEITTIRRVAQLRFAADIAPDAYAGYLQHDDQGHYSITHLPAGNDPMYRRVLAIRERDFLLVDTLNGNFDNFYREMQQPYSDWRRTRSEEAASLHQIEQDALKRKLLGVAAIVGAIAIEASGNGQRSASTGVLRDAMVLGGVYAIKTGFDKDSETGIHRDAIKELGDSFASETRPLVVEVEGQTHELTGSAEVQYARWRSLLKQIYASETGLDGGVE